MCAQASVCNPADDVLRNAQEVGAGERVVRCHVFFCVCGQFASQLCRLLYFLSGLGRIFLLQLWCPICFVSPERYYLILES